MEEHAAVVAQCWRELPRMYARPRDGFSTGAAAATAAVGMHPRRIMAGRDGRRVSEDVQNRTVGRRARAGVTIHSEPRTGKSSHNRCGVHVFQEGGRRVGSPRHLVGVATAPGHPSRVLAAGRGRNQFTQGRAAAGGCLGYAAAEGRGSQASISRALRRRSTKARRRW